MQSLGLQMLATTSVLMIAALILMTVTLSNRNNSRGSGKLPVVAHLVLPRRCFPLCAIFEHST